jgi:CDP-paratose 2-epimerase
MLEAITMYEEIRAEAEHTLSNDARSIDHIWYVSDMRSLQIDYPDWAHRMTCA